MKDEKPIIEDSIYERGQKCFTSSYPFDKDNREIYIGYACGIKINGVELFYFEPDSQETMEFHQPFTR